jgi:CRISPR-associated protein (TIGR02584 family)
MTHTLLAVSGMSPAVITETLYAILRDDLPWPDQLLVITTTLGAEKLADLHECVAALCQDYGCRLIDASRIKIAVVVDADGATVSDARSVADHEALGDFIMGHVRDLTSQPGSSVHASIAGGRKTMTFYLGYAMSLFGRAGDQLSHVLVADPFERVPDFRYPTPSSCVLRSLDGMQVDAADAAITLADIPFIRIREELPSVVLNIGEAVSFREVVNLINVAEAELTKQAIRLRLPIDRFELTIADRYMTALKSVPLSLLDYAFYRAVVRQNLTGAGVVQRPSKDFADTDLGVLLCEEMLILQGLNPKLDLLLTELLDQLEDGPLLIKSSTLGTLRANGGVSRSFFDSRCNTIKEKLEASLPARLCRWIALCNVSDEDGELIDFYLDANMAGARGGHYGVPLRLSSIVLV